MSDFLAMGGYAAFIWPAYLLAALLLGGLTWLSYRGMREREALASDLRKERDADRNGE